MNTPRKLKYHGENVPHVATDSDIWQKCYFCGTDIDLTIEHVIPKVIFKPNDPQQHVRLKACKKCNADKGKNDEYIARHLQATSFTTTARAGFKRGIQGLEHAADKGSKGAKGVGLIRNMQNRMTVTECHSPAGIYLGDAPAMVLDTERLEAFFTNIAKGLWVRNSLQFHDWACYRVTVLYEQIIQGEFLFQNPALIEMRRRVRFVEEWEDTFFYAGDYAETSSIWQMIFYKSFIAVVTFASSDFSDIDE